jgi:DNA-binding NtrC family response regulator
LRLAPLRERREDIPLLAEHFLEVLRQRSGRSIRLTKEALEAAMRHSWPGNVRQLQNVLERLAILSVTSIISEQMFADALGALDPGAKQRGTDSLSSREEDHIRQVLEATHGNKTRAAEILGIERKTLYRKLERMRSESS